MKKRKNPIDEVFGMLLKKEAKTCVWAQKKEQEDKKKKKNKI